MKTIASDQGYEVNTGVDRRSGKERRQRVDQRTNIRFDANGGDRRSSECRRSSDICLEILE